MASAGTGRGGVARSASVAASMSNPAPRARLGRDLGRRRPSLARVPGPAVAHPVGDQRRQARQGRLEPAHHLPEQADALAQGTVDVGLDRVRVVQVDDPDHRMPLPEPVDAPDALLDPHRVPGHVVVDERAAERRSPRPLPAPRSARRTAARRSVRGRPRVAGAGVACSVAAWPARGSPPYS
jgi:hypothetical protein